MPVSAARLLANRRNAARSTGPKTAEGKAASRRNSLKHGLTGDGVVLTPEAADAVTRRFETLKTDLQPSGEASRILLRRFAYLSVRLEKSEEFDTAATAQHVRHAVATFQEQRMTEVDWLVGQLPADPRTMTRRLQAMPEGIDWLIGHWGELRSDLMNPDRSAWTQNHWSRVEQLMGRPGGNFRMTRTFALTKALAGFFVYLSTGDGEGLDEAGRIEWARREFASLMDAEIAKLEALKAQFDPTLLERDRLEAQSRALFEASPERNLARKYEAATERAMYKALDQFHEVELAALEAQPIEPGEVPDEPETQADVEVPEELGSFLPDPEPARYPVPRSVYLVEARPDSSPKGEPSVVPRAKKRKLAVVL